MNYLLDTNICVYFMRGKRDVAAKIAEIGQEHFFISEMTLGELLYGAQCSDRPSENLRTVYIFVNMLRLFRQQMFGMNLRYKKPFYVKGDS